MAHHPIRSLLLEQDRAARVQRELWCTGPGGSTYDGLRNYLLCLSSQGLDAEAASGRREQGTAHTPSHFLSQPTSYDFLGTRCVLDASSTGASAPVTALAFANARNDLLAFANEQGDVFVAEIRASDFTLRPQARRAHSCAVASLAWSCDNSQLLSLSATEVVLWGAAEAVPLRSVAAAALGATAVRAGCFYLRNPSLALVGTSAGVLAVYNCSTGASFQQYPVPAAFRHAIEVTAVACSLHEVFVGDSEGHVHAYGIEQTKEGQLARLVWRSKLRCALTSGGAHSPITQLEHLPFCGATDCPLLLVTARDGTISLVAVRMHYKLSIHTRCVAPSTARDLNARACPLSAIRDLPRVVMGSQDACVHIYDLSASKPVAGSSRGSLLGALGASLKTATGTALGTPLAVKTLKGHMAPTQCVAWAFDESLLASGDAHGVVLCWERGRG